MKNKLSQRQRVEQLLLKQGFVSRNFYLNLPYHKILRLSEIIRTLRESGWDIETKEDKVDCVYTMVKNPYKKVVYQIEGREPIITYK